MSAEKTAKAAAEKEKRPASEKSVKTSETKKTARAPRSTAKKAPVAEVVVETAVEVAPEVAVAAPVKAKPAAAAKKTTAKAVKTTGAKSETLAHGVGRRKAAVARVFLKLGTGVITVNGEPVNDYFDTDITREAARAAFRAVPAAMRYDVLANVSGGGLSGQADAVKLGIARAILKADAETRSLLRMNGLLTVDDRVKERKKFGRKGARRGFQFVKR